MGKMKYLVVHCTDTPYDMQVTMDDIVKWHTGPRTKGDGSIIYKGKQVPVTKLESEYMLLPSGTSIKASKVSGRGWSQVGYSDMINRNGQLFNLVPYTFDNVIDSREVTNGAEGYNSESRHIVLAGGWSRDGKVKDGKGLKASDLYTPHQLDELESYIRMQLQVVPGLIVIGHNRLSKKTCPNFDVAGFCKDRGIQASHV
jgi:hypothetical protein